MNASDCVRTRTAALDELMRQISTSGAASARRWLGTGTCRLALICTYQSRAHSPLFLSLFTLISSTTLPRCLCSTLCAALDFLLTVLREKAPAARRCVPTRVDPTDCSPTPSVRHTCGNWARSGRSARLQLCRAASDPLPVRRQAPRQRTSRRRQCRRRPLPALLFDSSNEASVLLQYSVANFVRAVLRSLFGR